MRNSAAAKNAEQVFGHHLSAFAEGIEAILADYTEASVLITPDRNYVGLADIRKFFEAFLQSASKEFWTAFKVLKREVVGEIAYLTWSAPPFVPMATDTLWISRGAIAIQTFTPFSL
jgi:ketosteroid isomerase-like protein